MPINSLKTIICPDVQETTDTLNKTVVLKEKNKNTKFKGVKVHHLPDSIIVFKLDLNNKKELRKKSFYLSSEKDLHKACDYVIVCRSNGFGHIIFCELKSDCVKGGKRQLICTKPFWDYLVSLIRTHKGHDLSKFKTHYILFSTGKRLRKQRIKSSETRIEKYNGFSIKILGNPAAISFKRIIQ